MNINFYTDMLSKEQFVVFLFHGVIKESQSDVRNYNNKHILESDFESLLSELKRKGNPISISDCLSVLNGEQALQPNSFVISFDDGFENNLSVAAPVLSAMNIPAVYYITTDFVENNTMSWIDQIDYAVEQTTQKEITLSFLGESYSISSSQEKIILLDAIRNKIKNDLQLFRNVEACIQEVFDVCEIKRITSNQSALDLKMTWQQTAELGRHPLFTIGGHTHSHPIMSYLSEDALDYEISECLSKLKKATNTTIDHFSYPEGLEHCFNDVVIEQLKKYGIVCCPTAMMGMNDASTNPFHIRRVLVS